MFHTLQNLPTVYEGKKSTKRGCRGGGGVNNNKHKKSQWAQGHKEKNQWGHSEAVSAIPTTQILQPLFLSLFFVLLLHQPLLQSVGKWVERKKRRCTSFPTEGKCLGITTGCCWCSAVAAHRHLAAKLQPNVASCCLNKTHCFSLPAKSYSCRLLFFFNMMESSVFVSVLFVFQNLGLVFRVLAASCLRQYCHSSREALAIQRSSSATRLARVESTGSSLTETSHPHSYSHSNSRRFDVEPISALCCTFLLVQH